MKKKEKHVVKKPVVEASPAWTKGVRWVLLGAALLYVLSGFRVPSGPSAFQISDFGQLPVLQGGRIKPIDTLARASLLNLSGKQTVRFLGQKHSASVWLMEMLARPLVVDEWPVIRIDDPDVLGMMGIEQKQKRLFSFSDLHPYLDVIDQQSSRAAKTESVNRTRFQGAVLNLRGQILLYQRLQNSLDRSGRENSFVHLTHELEDVRALMKNHAKVVRGGAASPDVKRLSDFLNEYSMLDQVTEFYPFPSLLRRKSDHDWISAGQAVLQSATGDEIHPGLIATAKMLDAYRAEDSSVYNQALQGYRSWLEKETPSVAAHVRKEFYFNHVEPFYRALVLYLGIFFLVLIYWLSGRDVWRASAFQLLFLTFAVHTAGLVVRMVLHGRPPVTNLYSSAIFVGWVSVLLGIVLERFSKKGWGSSVSALIGFSTLIIAHNLASQGDTLEMMRAVLDSNFWLATHVVTITIGYGSTFLSGALGILYVCRRLLDRGWTLDAGASLERMGYGVVCFSLLFSFVGTILGGIWADQSWGRFWGWDPKENGALMIVLWNAFILHARWGKMVSERGLMAMMIFGNIITALSWFGVNMLGIGLHSYGFMDKAFLWLVVFVVIQFILIAAAFIPVHPIMPNGRFSRDPRGHV